MPRLGIVVLGRYALKELRVGVVRPELALPQHGRRWRDRLRIVRGLVRHVRAGVVLLRRQLLADHGGRGKRELRVGRGERCGALRDGRRRRRTDDGLRRRKF